MNAELLSLQQALVTCQGHREALQDALDDLNVRNIDSLDFEALSKTDRRLLDQFAYRYTRLQDDMGTRFLPSVLRAFGENVAPMPMLDRLNRLEQLGLLPSADEWAELRRIRNEFTHDYPVDRESGNITAEMIAQVLTPRTKAVICVHLAGWPCDMDPIMALAEAHDLKVIEDCAQAHGARYKGRSVGAIGHVGAWSFCQDKIMTTGGEGGMVTTNFESLWRSMWSDKDHGKSYEAVYERQHPPGFRWVHENFGANGRMMEMQAAIGRIQLRRMADWTAIRTKYAEVIWAACRPFAAVRVPDFVGDVARCKGNSAERSDTEHAHYKCYVYVQPEQLADGWSRDRVVEAINALGVPCYQGSCSEVYLEKAFDGTGWRPLERLPVARELGETALMFLVHPTLTEAEIEKTCTVVSQVLSEATG